MRIFTRYIFFEVLKLFLIALFAITMLLMLGFLVERAVVEGVGAVAILKLIPFLLPMSLQYALPATLLFAACNVYGRMSADNEIVAIKSIGITPFRVMVPTLLMALVLSPFAVWLMDIAASWGLPGMNRVVIHSLEEIVYGVLKTHHAYSGQGGLSIYVKDVEDRWLIKPVITIYSQEGRKPEVISAEKAKLALDPDNEQLLIEFYDYQIEDAKFTMIREKMDKYVLPLSRATRKGRTSDAPTQYSLRQMNGVIRSERNVLRTKEDALAARYATSLSLGRLDYLADPKTEDDRRARDASHNRLIRLGIEPWRRWASGFSCFFFVWLGIPMAIHMRNADYMMTFGICFLPILLIYFPFFILGLERAKAGEWPAYSVWLGNFFLLLIGSYMMRKVYRS
jgi:lipopolysaccharide export system permease protein